MYVTLRYLLMSYSGSISGQFAFLFMENWESFMDCFGSCSFIMRKGPKLQHIPHSHSITNADNWFQLESRNVMSKSWMVVQSSLIKGSLKRILIFIPIQFGAEKISYLFSCGNFSFVEIKSHLRNIFVLQNTPMYLYDVHNRMIFI